MYDDCSRIEAEYENKEYSEKEKIVLNRAIQMVKKVQRIENEIYSNLENIGIKNIKNFKEYVDNTTEVLPDQRQDIHKQIIDLEKYSKENSKNIGAVLSANKLDRNDFYVYQKNRG